MKKVFLLVSFFSTALLFSQNQMEFTIGQIAAQVSENSLQMEAAALNLEIAVKYAKNALKDKYPLFSANAGGSFGESNQPGTDEMAESQQISFSAGMDQLLPTGGNLNLTLSDSFSFSQSILGNEITQSPELRLSITQPLFLNAKLIDPEVYSARFDAVHEGTLLQEYMYKIEENRLIYEALSIFFSELLYKKKINLQKKTIELYEKITEKDRLLYEQGRISYKELTESEQILADAVNLGLQQEYAFLVNHHYLLSCLGLQEDVVIKTENLVFPVIEVDSEDILLNQALASNGNILIKQNAVNKTNREAVLGGLESALGMELYSSVRPSYPDSRSDSSSFASAFSDFFETGAGLDWTVGLNFSVPIEEMSKQKNKNEMNQSRIRQAEIDLEASSREVQNNLKELLFNKQFLNEKMTYLKKNLELERSRLAEIEQLFSLDSVTSMDVEEVQLEVLRKENELWDLQSLSFLNDLMILSLCGADLVEAIVEISL